MHGMLMSVMGISDIEYRVFWRAKLYVNKVFSSLLDLCCLRYCLRYCLSLSTYEKKLLSLLYTYGYVVYNSLSQKPTTIGGNPTGYGPGAN